MPRIVSVTEARAHFGALLQRAEETGEPVIVERRGRPVGVILSHAAFDEMRLEQQRLRRQEAWEQLRRLQERLASRPAEISEEEDEKLAEEAGRDIMESMIAKGLVCFADGEDRETGAHR